MTGMDMSNVPSSAVLWNFYSWMAVSAVVWGLAFWGLFQSKWVKSSARETAGGMRGRVLLRVGLGLLWIIDGVLQGQPDMSAEFVPKVLNPIIALQPSFLSHAMIQLVVLWSMQPVFFDLAAMWIQVTIGVCLLTRVKKIVRGGLWLSMAWGAWVWIFGEAMGGLFSGSASFFTGAPGPALLYILGALFLLLADSRWRDGTVVRYAQRAWVVLWTGCAVLQAVPAQGYWNTPVLSQWVASMAAMKQPEVLSRLLNWFVWQFSLHTAMWNGIFVTVMALLGIGWIWGARLRGLVPVTMGWLAFTWFIGQDFGVLGGLGTDVGISPIVALLMLATLKDEEAFLWTH